MSRYIDAELMKQILKPIEWGTPDERWIPEHEIGAMLDYFPAADVVEVVRCKDCKHRKYDDFMKELVCDLDAADPYERSRCAEDDGWFCKDGEREDG